VLFIGVVPSAFYCCHKCFYNHMYHKSNEIDTEGYRSLLSGTDCPTSQLTLKKYFTGRCPHPPRQVPHLLLSRRITWKTRTGIRTWLLWMCRVYSSADPQLTELSFLFAARGQAARTLVDERGVNNLRGMRTLTPVRNPDLTVLYAPILFQSGPAGV